MDNHPLSDIDEPLNTAINAESEADDDLSAIPYRTPLGNFVRRCSCVGGLLFWVVLFITPCICFVPLFVNGEVSLAYGGRPGQEIRLFRVSENTARGLGFSWGSIDFENDDGSYCVQTEVRYLLWEGDAENVGFCQCYVGLGDDQWDLAASYENDCNKIGNWRPNQNSSE